MKLSLNIGLAWPEVGHVYAVGYRGQTVGRIWLSQDRRLDAMSWEWHLCIPMTLPDDSRGLACSKEAALQALANSLHALVQRTQPDRLERAFLLSAATGLDFDGGEAVEVSVETAHAPAAIPADRPAQVRAPTLAAAVHALAQGNVSLPAVRPAVRKIMPTVKVRVVPAGKGGANNVAPRPAIAPMPSGQRPRLPATDV